MWQDMVTMSANKNRNQAVMWGKVSRPCHFPLFVVHGYSVIYGDTSGSKLPVWLRVARVSDYATWLQQTGIRVVNPVCLTVYVLP